MPLRASEEGTTTTQRSRAGSRLAAIGALFVLAIFAGVIVCAVCSRVPLRFPGGYTLVGPCAAPTVTVIRATVTPSMPSRFAAPLRRGAPIAAFLVVNPPSRTFTVWMTPDGTPHLRPGGSSGPEVATQVVSGRPIFRLPGFTLLGPE